MSAKWIRVTKKAKCPVCDHETWCFVSEDGKSALCMREVSPMQHAFKDGNVGYIHRLDGAPRRVQKREDLPVPVINVGKMIDEWAQWRRVHDITVFAASLGVSRESLYHLECVPGPFHRTWAFPMRDGYNNYIGIRLRNEKGEKWAVRGSHNGIFLPQSEAQSLALVCEGPTDTAAAITLGYFAVGRPSCSGGMPLVVTALKRLGASRAAIIADNDDPGLNGAMSLAKFLPIPSAIVVLPAKDIRAFVNAGGTKACLESIMNTLVWNVKYDSDTARSTAGCPAGTRPAA